MAPNESCERRSGKWVNPCGGQDCRIFHTHLQRLGINRIELSIAADAAGSGYHIALHIALQRHCNQLLVRESLHDAATS